MLYSTVRRRSGPGRRGGVYLNFSGGEAKLGPIEKVEDQSDERNDGGGKQRGISPNHELIKNQYIRSI